MAIQERYHFLPLFLICSTLLLVGACSSDQSADDSMRRWQLSSAHTLRKICPSDTPYQSGDACYTTPYDVVTFPINSASLSAQDKTMLDRQAVWMKEFPSEKIAIQGYANEKKTESQNLNLAELRAYSAKKYLISKKISADRIRLIPCLKPEQGDEFCKAPARIPGRATYTVTEESIRHPPL